MNIVPKLISRYEERIAVFDLYHQLNPRLTKEVFELRMKDLEASKYQLLGLFINEQCIAISGFWIETKLYCGKYLEPDNVVVDRKFRSQGIGEILHKELKKIALENNCEVMMLDAYLENVRGHAFYEKFGYVKKGYHMICKLSSDT